MRPYRPFVFVAALIATVYLVGWFSFVDRGLLDARTRLWSRPASGDLVVVAIDSASIRALAQWLWPRRYHAAAIQRLLAAGVSRIAYDIVFSSPSTPSDDLMLADALAAAGPERISLPVFRHLRQTHDRRIEPFDTAPLAQFGQHASAASINVEPDSDGLVRRLHGEVEWAGRRVPTMPAWLRSGAPMPEGEVFLDFGIDIRSIPMLSFVQLLRGDFDPALLAGHKVLVGAVATEIGDWISVPRYRALPGPLVQAIAFESLAQRRALYPLQGWPVALGAVLLVLAFGPAFGRLPWRRAVLLLGGGVLAITAAAMAIQLYGAVAVDTSAGLIGLVLAFAVATLERLEHQARALVDQIGSLPAADGMTRQLVDNSFDAIVTFGADGNVLSYNCAPERIFGVAGPDVIGAPLRGLLPDQHNGAFKTFAQAGGIHELEAKHGCGRRFPVEATFSRMQVDETWVGIAILRDVTERKLQQAELERMALHDALTGLPNRTLLHDRIEQTIRSAQRARHHMAVLLLDLDRFKDVNDTLGHDLGDLLLTEVGPRLQEPLRSSDTIARLGGDEFAILLLGPTDLERACGVAWMRYGAPLCHPGPIARGRHQHRRRALSRARRERQRTPAACRRGDVCGQARSARLRRVQPRIGYQQRPSADAHRGAAAGHRA